MPASLPRHRALFPASKPASHTQHVVFRAHISNPSARSVRTMYFCHILPSGLPPQASVPSKISGWSLVRPGRVRRDDGVEGHRERPQQVGSQTTHKGRMQLESQRKTQSTGVKFQVKMNLVTRAERHATTRTKGIEKDRESHTAILWRGDNA